MKVSELNQIFKTEEEKCIKIAELCDFDTKYPDDFYDDLNAIHKSEIKFLELLVEESHWLQLTESMGFSKGINIGHWPAEASERADAFLLTMFRFKNKKVETVKEKFRKLHGFINEVLK